MTLAEARVGFAVCGSYCTFLQVFPVLEQLTEQCLSVQTIFSERAARTNTRFGLAAEFLTIDGEVLRTCGNAVTLDASNQARRHTTGDDRIFGIILEITTAQRVALNVHARTEQYV